MDPYDHCAELVRRGDRDRYIADLFAPGAARRHLVALQAFNLEVETVAERVTEPLAGEIRLQWWRDVLAGTAEGATGHPVAAALTATIRECRLPLDRFDALIDAHQFDLHGEPMPSLAGLEAYGRATEGVLFHLSALAIAGAPAETLAATADVAGMAVQVSHTLVALPRSARNPSFLPADVAARHGLDPAAPVAGAARGVLRPMIEELAVVGRRHLAAARTAVAALPPDTRLAFLPLALAGPAFDRVTAAGHDPLAGKRVLSPLRRYWLLWRAALKARG